MPIYYSEVKRTVNTKTGKTRYYVKKCGVFSRIGRAEYEKRYDEATGLSCLWNKLVGDSNHCYTTLIYDNWGDL